MNYHHTLWSLRPQGTGIVKSMGNHMDPSYQLRLRDFGIEEGAEVLCLRHTLMGGPRVYQIRGFCVSFEQKIAEQIFIETEMP